MQFRPEIQGLRALAVVSVVLFHIWPNVIPGGFVGVDVFFVISGYLITSVLFREVQERGEISLLNFYERRIRRIVPAATLVLLVIAVSVPLLPEVRWEETAQGIIAAALYFENWHLSQLAVDYLGAENLPSPVQHYWSLSIEEQFYIVWPVLMMAASLFSRKWPAHRRVALIFPLAMVVLASFIASIMLTTSEPEFAYFATHTRIWELGLGALLALIALPKFSAWPAEILRVVGIAAIAYAGFEFSVKTVFPGYAAALPTLGCALVIAAGSQAPAWSIRQLLNSRIAQYLGDISYSVYLWHWPLIVFMRVVAPERLSVLGGLAIIVATLGLAHLTKVLVEDRFRRGRGSPVRVISFGVVAIVTCAVLPIVILFGMIGSQTTTAADARYPGAAALFGAPVPEFVRPIPSLSRVKKDLPAAYSSECHLPLVSSTPNPCRLGNPEGRFKVVLVGDSHAAQWIPVLEDIAKTQNWQLITHTKSSCPLLKTPIVSKKLKYSACLDWGRAVLDQLRASPPDLVLYTQARHGLFSEKGEPIKDDMAAAIGDVWKELELSGIAIAAIRDTPRMPFQAAECLSIRGHCVAERKNVLDENDPVVVAAAVNRAVPLIDMTDGICTATQCPAVIGNVVVWRDSNHLTVTYVRTLAPFFLARLQKAVPAVAAASSVSPNGGLTPGP